MKIHLNADTHSGRFWVLLGKVTIDCHIDRTVEPVLEIPKPLAKLGLWPRSFLDEVHDVFGVLLIKREEVHGYFPGHAWSP